MLGGCSDGPVSYARVTSVLAIVIALTASAGAAVRVSKNSVGPKQIKKGAVVKVKIARGAVTSPKIRNGALTAADLSDDASTVGPKGATGDSGPKALQAVYYYSSDTTVQPGFNVTLGLGCSLGVPKLIGGGVRVTAPGTSVVQSESYPQGEQWHASVVNGSAQAQTVTIYSICTVSR